MKSMTRHGWTAEEETLLRSAYPWGGVAACGSLLERHTKASIVTHASNLGVKREGKVRIARSRVTTHELPCTKYDCPNRGRCAKEELACGAMLFYVRTGRSVDPYSVQPTLADHETYIAVSRE